MICSQNKDPDLNPGFLFTNTDYFLKVALSLLASFTSSLKFILLIDGGKNSFNGNFIFLNSLHGSSSPTGVHSFSGMQKSEHGTTICVGRSSLISAKMPRVTTKSLPPSSTI